MRAEEYFHLAPYNWNCAQSIHKAYQATTGLTDELIELQYRGKGGGRAEGGVCGAIYAVQTLVDLGSQEAERLTDVFAQRAGGLTCRDLKGQCGRSCKELVALAQEVLEEAQVSETN